MEGTVIAEGGAAQAAHDVHKICYVIVHKDDIIHLLAKVQRRHQQHGDRDAAGEARQRGEHDKHEHDAGRPSSPVWGNRMHCSTPVTSAVNKIPLSSGMLPYFSSMGGPTTNSSSILLRKCSQFAWPSTWPNSRM